MELKAGKIAGKIPLVTAIARGPVHVRKWNIETYTRRFDPKLDREGPSRIKCWGIGHQPFAAAETRARSALSMESRRAERDAPVVSAVIIAGGIDQVCPTAF